MKPKRVYSKVSCGDCTWTGYGNELTNNPNIREHCPNCKSERIFSPRDLAEHPEIHSLYNFWLMLLSLGEELAR
jgi:hypothetical protein